MKATIFWPGKNWREKVIKWNNVFSSFVWYFEVFTKPFRDSRRIGRKGVKQEDKRSQRDILKSFTKITWKYLRKILFLKSPSQMFSCEYYKIFKDNYFVEHLRCRSSRPEVFCEKGILRNFAKLTGKQQCQTLFFNGNFIKKETLALLFSCEFCEISKNTFSYRTFPVAASVNMTFQNAKWLFFCFWHLIKTFLLKSYLF